MDAESGIAWPDDAKNEQTKNDCLPKAIILYRDGGAGSPDSYLIDRASLGLLSGTNQAGLWAHETIYKVLRETVGATDSILARKITALLFSDASAYATKDWLRRNAGWNIDATYEWRIVDAKSHPFDYFYDHGYRGEDISFELLIQADPANPSSCGHPPVSADLGVRDSRIPGLAIGIPQPFKITDGWSHVRLYARSDDEIPAGCRFNASVSDSRGHVLRIRALAPGSYYYHVYAHWIMSQNALPGAME